MGRSMWVITVVFVVSQLAWSAPPEGKQKVKRIKAFADSNFNRDFLFTTILPVNLCFIDEQQFMGCFFASQFMLNALHQDPQGPNDFYLLDFKGLEPNGYRGAEAINLSPTFSLYEKAATLPGQDPAALQSHQETTEKIVAHLKDLYQRISAFYDEKVKFYQDDARRLNRHALDHLEKFKSVKDARAKLTGKGTKGFSFWDIKRPSTHDLDKALELHGKEYSIARQQLTILEEVFLGTVGQGVFDSWIPAANRQPKEQENYFLSRFYNTYLRYSSDGRSFIDISYQTQIDYQLINPATPTKNLSVHFTNHQGTNMGVLRIAKFVGAAPGSGEPQLCYEIAEILDHNDEDVGGWVVDLRNNPGGFYNEAECLLELFHSEGISLIGESHLTDPGVINYYVSALPAVTTKPVVILTNRASASASEIFAGVMQETGRGLVVGEKTFGKGSFQGIVDQHPVFPELQIMNVLPTLHFYQTGGYYHFPSGHSPEGIGVQPDIPIGGPSTPQDIDLTIAQTNPWAKKPEMTAPAVALNHERNSWLRQCMEEDEPTLVREPALGQERSSSADPQALGAFAAMKCLVEFHNQSKPPQ